MDVAFDDLGLAANAAPETLIAHILDRFHATHRRELPQLLGLARRVETTHAEHASCPTGLADFLAGMQDELEAHMMKEEQVLFPTLLAGGGGCAPFAIRRMRMEHDDHAAQLERLRRLTNDSRRRKAHAQLGLCSTPDAPSSIRTCVSTSSWKTASYSRCSSDWPADAADRTAGSGASLLEHKSNSIFSMT
jgi:hypothetical protein